MSDISSEPTMEDILSSIKKIISEDSAKVLAAPRSRRGAAREEAAIQPVADPQTSAATEEEDVLELTETSPEPEALAEDAPVAAAPTALVSPNAETASRSALDALSALIVKPEVHGTDTLEGLVREMLRPMLKEWLDANLPQLVESLVSKEISRITGKSLI